MEQKNKNNQPEEAKPELPAELPIIVMKDMVIFPNVIFPLSIAEEHLIKMISDTLEGNRTLAAFAHREAEKDDGGVDFYSVGTAVGILKMFRVPDGSIRLLVQGISRIKFLGFAREEPYRVAKVTPIAPDRRRGKKIEALSRLLMDEFREVMDHAPYISDDIKSALINIKDAEVLADLIASNLNISLEERQKLLEIRELENRLREVSSLVSKELKLLKLRDKIKGDVDEELEKSQRQYYLRQQLVAIKKELGEEDEHTQETQELEKRLLETPMPVKAKEAAKKELARLAKMSPASAEYTVSRTYLDWILELPWEISTQDALDLANAKKILDDDHYGLDDIKERILEYLAVRKLKKTTKGAILCFAGPPGVGKTSLGRSIAKATGRKFVRIALGGMRDEAEIRGHRRTYIGALPGRILQALRNAGANNPVFMLDEIDKVGQDFRGNPESALLEVLDPEQNNSFTDHYLDLEFDLSKIMFITTANVTYSISPPLLDRMEVIQLPGYITQEKVEIARRYLVTRQIEEHGLKQKDLSFTPGALDKIVTHYTREAGVRNLEREIATVCRKVAYKIAGGETVKERVTVNNFTDYLGEPKFLGDIADHPPMVGVATGLAYTPVGGQVLLIESTVMPGGKAVHLTGRLGEVMKESAEIALSYLRSRAKKYGVKSDFFTKHEFHIHIPEGATPKDGPSAGVTMATALASVITGRKVRNDLAMTGEITLRGTVLPIGGLREKVVAAVRSNIKEVIIPELNKKDLKDIPQDVLSQIQKFHYVKTIDNVLNIALLPK
jgi:ATP-dependent Lon protease